MTSRTKSAIIALTTLAPSVALAEAGEQVEQNSSLLLSVFYSILPIVLIGCLVFFFFKFVLRKQQSRSDAYIATITQHNQRVEQLLERIAVAVEKWNGSDHRGTK